jgi:predicted transcriptional regulator
MISEGLTQSEVARRLNVSQQAVSQVVESISERVTTALNDAASLNEIEPRFIDSNRGIMLGWSNCFNTETVITFNPEMGLHVYYQNRLGDCKVCLRKRTCKSKILKNAQALGISLTSQERNLSPSELSGVVFSRVIGQTNFQK